MTNINVQLYYIAEHHNYGCIYMNITSVLIATAKRILGPSTPEKAFSSECAYIFRTTLSRAWSCLIFKSSDLDPEFRRPF